MDKDQLPAGMFTPERPSANNANDPNNTVRFPGLGEGRKKKNSRSFIFLYPRVPEKKKKNE